MAIVGVLTTVLSGNNAPLLGSLAQSEAAMKGYASSASANAALARSAFLGIGIVAVAGMGLAIKAAADFQAQMATVNTIAHQTPEELKATGDQIRALSVATGVGLPDLTSSFYDLLSVGVPVGKAMEFLTNATTLSIGGLSTSKEAVDAITTSINAWSGAQGAANLSMNDSLRVADLWAKGIEVGGFTAADIGTALSQVAAQASNFNTPLEQVVATAALLTTRGFTASTALTSMDAAFTALQRVPPGMEKLQKATGKSYEQIARTQGIHEAITQVVADAGRFGVGLVDVFGRTDALGYVINTTGANARAYEQILGSMYSTSGTAAGQAAERSATLDRQMQILGASVNDLGITLGTALLPPLTTLVQGINGIVQGVGQWASANPQLAGAILPVVAGVAALSLAVLGANVVIGAMGVLLSPIALTFLAISAAILLVVNNIDAIRAGIQAVSDAVAKFNAEHGGAPLPGTGRGDEAIGARTPQIPRATGIGAVPGQLADAIGFTAGLGGAAVGGLGDQIFRGGRPETIALTHTTNINVDGDKIAALIERRVYANAGVYNSGFSSDDSSHHQ